MSDSDDIKAVVRLNADGSMTRVERVSSSQSSDDDWQKDPMTLLLMAYREMLNKPDCSPLLDPLMDVIRQKERMMVQRNKPMEGY
ncbi:MAG: hypothetical protein CMQ41_15510 [Gammaproteobacteria bacterium]|nr:hypothetical protein [Gammaproteobacteria bacterium]